jgi:hypothetical protein
MTPGKIPKGGVCVNRFWAGLGVLAVSLAACNRGANVPTRRVVIPFHGEVDATTGLLRLRADRAPSAAGFVEAPVVSDDTPGTGPADTVELVTESVPVAPDPATVAGGCGVFDGFEGTIRLRSFYTAAVLKNAYVEILSISRAGREACNSAPAPTGLSGQFGLFSYGTIGRAGSGFDSSLAAWRFQLPDQSSFTFQGHVVADLVPSDVTPPVTTASPPAGTYAPGLAVTLACSDAEAGCAATYYTTDGSTPTNASAVFAGPIPITTPSTLRWFSVDYAGNPSALQSAAYLLDATPPTVASVTPAPGKVGIATASTIAVTFSEAIDPASVTTTSFSVSGPSGALAGTITPDGPRRVFTFTPSAALEAESQYSVTVTSGVRDVAGNALSPSFASTFYTVTTPRIVERPTSARLGNHAVVHAYTGNGLAAWSAATPGGAAIVYATFSAASGLWSTGTVLATERGSGNARPIRVAVDGNGQYLLVWCTTTALRAARIQSNGALVGVVSDLATGGASLTAADLTASSTAANRYLVVRSYLGNVGGFYWNGTTWSTETAIGSGSGPVLSGSTVYFLGSDNVSVRAPRSAAAPGGRSPR